MVKEIGYYSRPRVRWSDKGSAYKKAKWDFYTVLPIVICLMLMVIFNIISDINSLGDGTY